MMTEKRTKRRRNQSAGERVAEPVGVRVPIPADESARYYWPEGAPLPKVYARRPPYPCPQCMRVLTTHASQAVVCDGIKGGAVAYMRCRSCEHRWKLPAQ